MVVNKNGQRFKRNILKLGRTDQPSIEQVLLHDPHHCTIEHVSVTRVKPDVTTSLALRSFTLLEVLIHPDSPMDENYEAISRKHSLREPPSSSYFEIGKSAINAHLTNRSEYEMNNLNTQMRQMSHRILSFKGIIPLSSNCVGPGGGGESALFHAASPRRILLTFSERLPHQTLRDRAKRPNSTSDRRLRLYGEASPPKFILDFKKVEQVIVEDSALRDHLPETEPFAQVLRLTLRKHLGPVYIFHCGQTDRISEDRHVIAAPHIDNESNRAVLQRLNSIHISPTDFFLFPSSKNWLGGS
ncbi:hypothetical protein J6590_025517 [Homalodisca vitripennis]|nr:hypothetical protein J6590_025517 [Homalodisca vitripennis]